MPTPYLSKRHALLSSVVVVMLAAVTVGYASSSGLLMETRFEFFAPTDASARITSKASTSTAPVITNVSVSNVTDTSVSISWLTDIPSDSRLRVWIDKPYGLRFTDTAKVTTHSLTATGLKPNTRYGFVARSSANGKLATSQVGVFTTASSVSTPSPSTLPTSTPTPTLIATPVPSPTPSSSTAPTTTSTPTPAPTSTPIPSPITGGPSIAELPRVYIDTTYNAPTGPVKSVVAGTNLQTALDAASCGDVIELPAGSTFTGGYWLNKACPPTNRITIRSSGHANLPVGKRISPSQAQYMAKIVANDPYGNEAGLNANLGSSGYRLIGLEVTTNNTGTSRTQYALVSFGNDRNGNEATSLAQAPNDFILDRMYIHGTPGGNVRRGVWANSRALAVIDSHVSDIHEVGADSQAVAGWSGPGPFKIVNNYLEGAGENVMFGGATAYSASFIPSDLEFRHNYVSKNLAWKGNCVASGGCTGASPDWTNKNLFELKDMQRALIDGNVFANNWADAQNGFAILFTVRGDGNPDQTVEDVTFQNNVVHDSASGMNIGVQDDYQVSQQERRMVVRNNLFYNIDNSLYGGDGRLFQIVGGYGRIGHDFDISHNSFIHGQGGGSACLVNASAPPNVDVITFRDNLCTMGSYGFYGENSGFGGAAINGYWTNMSWNKNLLIGDDFGLTYPSGSLFASTVEAVGFTNASASDYRLSTSSLYRNAGTDGKDIGADVNSINMLTSSVVSGQ